MFDLVVVLHQRSMVECCTMTSGSKVHHVAVSDLLQRIKNWFISEKKDLNAFTLKIKIEFNTSIYKCNSHHTTPHLIYELSSYECCHLSMLYIYRLEQNWKLIVVVSVINSDTGN